MAHGYTSVAPGDSNDGWVGWRAGIDPVIVLDFFNKFASQSGHMAYCNRFMVANHRGHNSFSFDLVESYGFEKKPTITVTVTLDDDVRFKAFPFAPNNDLPSGTLTFRGDALIFRGDILTFRSLPPNHTLVRETDTRNWLCEAYAWARQQFGGKNMFGLSDTCPLLPDPVVIDCPPCFEDVLGETIPSDVLSFGGQLLLFRGEFLTFNP